MQVKNEISSKRTIELKILTFLAAQSLIPNLRTTYVRMYLRSYVEGNLTGFTTCILYIPTYKIG